MSAAEFFSVTITHATIVAAIFSAIKAESVKIRRRQ